MTKNKNGKLKAGKKFLSKLLPGSKKSKSPKHAAETASHKTAKVNISTPTGTSQGDTSATNPSEEVKQQPIQPSSDPNQQQEGGSNDATEQNMSDLHQRKNGIQGQTLEPILKEQGNDDSNLPPLRKQNFQQEPYTRKDIPQDDGTKKSEEVSIGNDPVTKTHNEPKPVIDKPQEKRDSISNHYAELKANAGQNDYNIGSPDNNPPKDSPTRNETPAKQQISRWNQRSGWEKGFIFSSLFISVAALIIIPTLILKTNLFQKHPCAASICTVATAISMFLIGGLLGNLFCSPSHKIENVKLEELAEQEKLAV